MRPFFGPASLPACSACYVYGVGEEGREIMRAVARHPDCRTAEFVAPRPQGPVDGIRVWTPESLRAAVGRTAAVVIAAPADAVERAARDLAAQGFNNVFDPRPFWRRRALEARLGPPARTPESRALPTAAAFRRLPPACYVYGVGLGGALVRAAVEAAGRRVLGFVDSFRAGVHDGLPVLDPAGLADALAAAEPPRPAVVTASVHWGELEAALDRVGVDDRWDAYPYVAFTLGRRAWAPVPRDDGPAPGAAP